SVRVYLLLLRIVEETGFSLLSALIRRLRRLHRFSVNRLVLLSAFLFVICGYLFGRRRVVPTRDANARHRVTRRNFAQLRIDPGTFINRNWATSAKPAARRRINRRWHITLQDNTLAFFVRIRHR